jgi:predicted XRE-type DNA-binding protein
MKKNKDYFIGSDNVFADLGLPNPEERLAKAELALQINRLIQQKKLTQVAVAKLLDIDQPKISALNTGKLAGFSLGRLIKFLTALGQDVTIKVSKPKARRKANVIVDLPKMKKSPIIKQPAASSHTSAIHAKKQK